MATAAMGFYSTSVGKKAVMALTGFIVFGFVVGHMLGNLQIFLGPEKINSYAAFLQSLGGALWVIRGVLLVATLLHVISATQVTLQSLSARPVRYKIQRFQETTYAARTMVWGGPIIALFVIYHLAHLTIGSAHPNFDASNVYNNVIYGFQVPWVSGLYIGAILAVGFHLYHGAWSMFQSMGVNHPKWNVWRRVFAIAFALVVTMGNLSIPVLILAGQIHPV